ncbi:MAG TPA: tetratricopeptide repeat protein [Kofleriaceae bacterium]|nr:tetratricopeptide repeat protein [Kofleriaceae bacterium]
MRIWPALVVSLMAALVVGIAPRAAAAEDQPCPRPQRAVDDRARALYRDGERLYAAGRYGESIAAFRAALERSRRPELYFDLANAHEHLGDAAEAAGLLERYLRCARPADAGLVRERLRRLRASAVRLGPTTCPVAETPEPQAAVRLEAVDRIVAAEQDRARSRPRAWPWLVTGGGALAAAIGLAVAADATRPPACAHPEQGRACLRMPIDASAALERTAIVAGAAGAIALAAGAVIAVRARGETRTGEPRRAMPWIAPGAVGVAWGGAF